MLSFASPEKEFFIYIYDVITSQKKALLIITFPPYRHQYYTYRLH